MGARFEFRVLAETTPLVPAVSSSIKMKKQWEQAYCKEALSKDQFSTYHDVENAKEEKFPGKLSNLFFKQERWFP